MGSCSVFSAHDHGSGLFFKLLASTVIWSLRIEDHAFHGLNVVNSDCSLPELSVILFLQALHLLHSPMNGPRVTYCPPLWFIVIQSLRNIKSSVQSQKGSCCQNTLFPTAVAHCILKLSLYEAQVYTGYWVILIIAGRPPSHMFEPLSHDKVLGDLRDWSLVPALIVSRSRIQVCGVIEGSFAKISTQAYSDE